MSDPMSNDMWLVCVMIINNKQLSNSRSSDLLMVISGYFLLVNNTNRASFPLSSTEK